MSPLLLQRIGLGIVFAWFFFGGIGHFAATGFFAGIVPPWIPVDARLLVYVSGVFELLGAIGILIPSVRQWAGNGLFLLTLCVTPANLHMALNPELFPGFPPVLLWLRMVIQVALLACIWWSTRDRSPAAATAYASNSAA
ncbi:hypothetical protein D0B54_08065 [Solimonas sp. K1W22B-7]|uniref:DoxX family protein n=1 Tax=Solimonas sp. K1W22B-7 TaxID=2303331 RepID=UPI000E32F68A|nr:hypothetical protein [Solimonas sp. K1W22B-7]AXQ28637.1 hypothetical protein D0B54_08065 [Solimonas sp. K1W22B-7]